MSCTSRERVVTALRHKEPDRVPIGFGGLHDSIHLFGHRKLKEYLGLSGEDIIQDPFQQIVFPIPELMEKFQADALPVYANPGAGFEMRYYDEGEFRKYGDEWGTVYRQPKKGGIWFDFESHVWQGKTAEEIRNWKLPDPLDPVRFKDVRAKAKHILDTTDKAIVAYAPTGGVYEHTYWLRSMEDAFMDMAGDLPTLELITERIVQWMELFWDRYMEELGDLIQVVQIGDDLGGQDGPLFSPEIYRRYFKPREKRVIETIKKKTDAKIYFHSCGAVREFIPDLIDIGVDVLNPVQVGAARMGSDLLKKDFGDAISFWGGGADPVKVMSKGSTRDVREEVKRRIGDLAPGGGFVFASIHNIQADVPPENVIAFFEAALEYGQYA